ncbi:MAG: N-acetyltransferase [Rhodospirillales bacterium]|nr:N-acetyltransferase [Rhodospirillales bacterium]MSP81207.1 N-acetyltransferase [Rhodospirillales bacterium]
MPDGREPLSARTLTSIHDVTAEAWDALAGARNPFVSHGFLAALEDSGSATASTGWAPMHLVIEDSSRQALAAAPLYLKSHSYGEYVFDHAWADAYGRAGGRYYPKLLSAVPFTPATGPRLLVPPGLDPARAGELRATLASALIQVAERIGVSSLHVNFPGPEDARALGQAGYLSRLGVQYHWQNRGYASFDDFLGNLASRKRKAIRKERAGVRAAGVVLTVLTGPDVREAHWDAFHAFYRDTTERKWGGGYLTREFFSLLGERMAERVVLVMAEHGGTPVAGALNLLGHDTLYGRHWGCVADFRFLHFEACYYQAIEFAIARGLSRVEAGAQGEHKIQRGYLPEPTLSFHWLKDEAFRALIARHLERERAAVAAELGELAGFSPYRQS